MSASDYRRVFNEERQRQYPEVDALEGSLGFALDRATMEAAAEVLACPLKVNPPSWQHGRVVFAAARRYLADTPGHVRFLDIGTAKGYSALCLQWALIDGGRVNEGEVHSVDVMEPSARVRRNSVLELVRGRYCSLNEYLTLWPEARGIKFHQSTGVEWLERHPGRVNLAFVDGKHSYEAVAREGALIAGRQEPGDIVVFDDVHMPGVAQAVGELSSCYGLRTLGAGEGRRYAVGTRA